MLQTKINSFYWFLVTRGTMFGIQHQRTLNTIEVYVNRTKILRNNMNAILDAEDAWRHYYKTNKKRKPANGNQDIFQQKWSTESAALKDLTFHVPLHCLTNHEEGEFVFMGRRRFEEMMIICAPPVDDWDAIVNQLNKGDNAPCILNS